MYCTMNISTMYVRLKLNLFTDNKFDNYLKKKTIREHFLTFITALFLWMSVTLSRRDQMFASQVHNK